MKSPIVYKLLFTDFLKNAIARSMQSIFRWTIKDEVFFYFQFYKKQFFFIIILAYFKAIQTLKKKSLNRLCY